MKKKTGRPRKEKADMRSERVAYRVTPDELLRIEAAALRSNVSVSDYARHAALTARAPTPPKGQPTMAAITELNRVGVNLHQIAKHLNIGTGHIPHDLGDVLEDIKNAITKLTEDDG